MQIRLPDDIPKLTEPQLDTAAQALRKQWVTCAQMPQTDETERQKTTLYLMLLRIAARLDEMRGTYKVVGGMAAVGPLHGPMQFGSEAPAK